MRKSLFLATLVAALLCSASAQAQFRFGIKAGANVSELALTSSLSESFSNTFKTQNITSFTGGIMGEYISPVGLGAEVGVMYTRKGSKLDLDLGTFLKPVSATAQMDYIEVPLNLKYRLAIPAIDNLAMPFVFAGPSFLFRVADNLEDYKEVIESKDFEVALNVGLGVELFNHLQISCQYGWGLGDALTVLETDITEALVNGKSRAWTVTAAYFF